MHRTFVAVVLVIASLLAGRPAVAQQTEARIAGTISDQNGGVLPGVTVTVTSAATGAVRTAVTDEQGRYTITNLPPGTYTVAAELSRVRRVEAGRLARPGRPQDGRCAMQVAGLTEAVTVAAERHRRSISPRRGSASTSRRPRSSNLPVNGRNFANLMTLATGATTDGNGGWASVRFNGKSNQQNYLNYDGVDGTYVWDASPGYLNATGSQFRLQTSMESIAEFRVNSGLAPAESGLGAGGNITVISKSGAQPLHRLGLRILPQRRARLGEQVRRQEAGARVQPVRRLDRRPDRRNRTFFFASYEGLKQTTGLSFTEAVPSDEAIRRIMAGEPIGSGARPERRAHAGGGAAARGFPARHRADGEPRCSPSPRSTPRPNRERTRSRSGVDHRFSNSQSLYARLLYSDGEVDTPDRTVTPRRVLATQQPMNFVANHQADHRRRA